MVDLFGLAVWRLVPRDWLTRLGDTLSLNDG